MTRDAHLRSYLRSGLDLSPLPHSLDELRAIAEIFPERTSLFLGERATEEQAKSTKGAVSVLHFATHALVDEKLPMNSGLILSVPDEAVEGREDGLLQAWEIFEKLRVQADLVPLSACQTALGQNAGGEGLIGLARAFQYAGARTVMASLWEVRDSSTSELMKRFYGFLKSGLPKDEALRRAQTALMKDPRHRHPFHWAAFRVIGDWN